MIDQALNNTNEVSSSGARLVSVNGQTLPLLGTRVSAEAKSGLARVVVSQRFRNVHAEPLRVSYLLPLPADGAVSGFRFRLGDRTIEGEIDRKAAARERFERALVEGKTAAILDQERTSLFTQEIGNIPAGAEVSTEVTIDQPLIWLVEGEWEWRFPTVVMPRYLGAPGELPDAEKISVDVADATGSMPNRFELSLAIGDAIVPERKPSSPSHSIMSQAGGKQVLVSLEARGGVKLDRDVVVHWPVTRPEVGVSAALARPVRKELRGSTFGLLTLVPPELPNAKDKNAPVPSSFARDLILLIDVSGSMSGSPLEQAKRIISSMIESLVPTDRLEMLAFASDVSRWTQEAALATAEAKKEALRWVKGLSANGSTEMVNATVEALAPLRNDAQRQVVLITDGGIGNEEVLLRTVINKLPRNSRLHMVGVGSAVNRSVTQAASRAGGGVEVIIGLDEDVERGTKRIMDRTRAPLVTDMEITGKGLLRIAPKRIPDLYAGSPAMVAVELDSECRSIHVKGRSVAGPFEQTVQFDQLTLGEGHQAVVQRFGRELVEDLETILTTGGASANDTDRAVERAGLDFQISTRLTSWVAISSEQTVKVGEPTRSEKVPHELPYGMSVQGLGLRGPDAVLGEVTEFEDGSTIVFDQKVAPRMQSADLTRAIGPSRGHRAAQQPASRPAGRSSGSFSKRSGPASYRSGKMASAEDADVDMSSAPMHRSASSPLLSNRVLFVLAILLVAAIFALVYWTLWAGNSSHRSVGAITPVKTSGSVSAPKQPTPVTPTPSTPGGSHE
jgi:Ca-activated chloride channel family protein